VGNLLFMGKVLSNTHIFYEDRKQFGANLFRRQAAIC
jgi:hypothetical protein